MTHSSIAGWILIPFVFSGLTLLSCRPDGEGPLQKPATASTAAVGELKWQSFSSGLQSAAASHRKILIDVYTNWCGWCKRMDKDVYADENIRKYLTDNFEVVKLNAESDNTHDVNGSTLSEKQIASSWGITGYPTTVFLDSTGGSITSIPGYINAQTFRNVLEFIHEDVYKTTSWDDFLRKKGGN